MARGRKPTPSILRLIAGAGHEHKERLRDDHPKVARTPDLPPIVTLSDAEVEVWHWLLKHVYVPGVHGTSDSFLLIKICKLWCRAMDAERHLQRFGCVIDSPRDGRPMLHPYYKVARDAWRELGPSLSEAGCTPAGRIKFAAPRASPGDTGWDDIGP
jgi:Phage terminase, small subunit